MSQADLDAVGFIGARQMRHQAQHRDRFAGIEAVDLTPDVRRRDPQPVSSPC